MAYYGTGINCENKEEKMSNMDRKTALEILKKYQEWRRYNGPVDESPAMPDPKEIGQAIDVAIRELERTTQTAPNKEYYGG